MLALFVLASALAAEQRIVYDLVANGEKVGTRDVTVRYLSRDDGERRVIESWTELAMAGTALKCRTSGSASPKGAQFSSAVEQDGVRTQIQGTELPGGGWRLVVEDAAGVKERTLAREEARISSLDLWDPSRNRVLTAPGPVAIVMVETGDVLAGTVDEGQPGQIKVGAQKVPVTRYTVNGGVGKAKFDLDESGLLLRSEVQWLGGTVIATARDAPPPRTFGEVETIEKIEVGVQEETPL